MTEMMKRFEEETGKQALIYTMVYVSIYEYDYGELVPTEEYNNWLEAKAEAYDRLMSGGDKTPKDIVNFLGKPGVITDDGDLLIFDSIPIVNMCFDEQTGEPYDDIRGANQFAYIDGEFESSEYDDVVLPDNWKDSPTLPDGWETKGD